MAHLILQFEWACTMLFTGLSLNGPEHGEKLNKIKHNEFRFEKNVKQGAYTCVYISCLGLCRELPSWQVSELRSLPLCPLEECLESYTDSLTLNYIKMFNHH